MWLNENHVLLLASTCTQIEQIKKLQEQSFDATLMFGFFFIFNSFIYDATGIRLIFTSGNDWSNIQLYSGVWSFLSISLELVLMADFHRAVSKG